MTVRRRPTRRLAHLWKRPFDLVACSAALILISPILVVVAVLVRIKLGSPVLFSQERPGRDGVPFNMIKFRTMIDANDEHGEPLPDEDRITPFGAALRRTSLDELPELFNVMKGEMSLVGPRPLLMQYLPLYSEEQNRRHEVRPGVTGLAQTSGRNAIGWNEKFSYDIEYVDNCSPRLDFQILLQTVLEVVRGTGVDQDGLDVGADFFLGND